MHLRILIAAAAACLAAAGIARAAPYPVHPSSAGYVNDFADVMNPAERERVEQRLRDFNGKTQDEIVVVTVPSLQGEDITTYGVGLGRAWGIGKKGADNGVLLLFAPNEHKVTIQVGKRLEPYLTDAAAKLILHEAVHPLTKQKRYGDAAYAGVQAIIMQLTTSVSASEQRAVMSHAQAKNDAEGGVGILVFILFLGAVIFVAYLAMKMIGRKKKTDVEPEAEPAPERDEDPVRNAAPAPPYYREAPSSGTGSFLAGAAIGSALAQESEEDDPHPLGSSASEPEPDPDPEPESGVDLGGGSFEGGGAEENDD